MSEENVSQIRIHTKRAQTTRGSTGEISVETINAETISTASVQQAVDTHFYLEQLVRDHMGIEVSSNVE
tara:strand:+ start:718 stop:924 length:207 start_codon:yes stop_codon:yes gene_type:complete